MQEDIGGRPNYSFFIAKEDLCALVGLTVLGISLLCFLYRLSNKRKQ
jgi:hypothetical protein